MAFDLHARINAVFDMGAVQRGVRDVQRTLDGVRPVIAPTYKSGGALDALRHARELGAAYKETAVAARGLSGTGTSFGVGFSVATSAVGAFTNAVRDSVQHAAEWQRSLTRMKAMTTESAAEVTGLGRAVGEMSRAYGTSSAEMLRVAASLKAAGLTVNEVKASVEALNKASFAPGFDSLEEASRGLVDSFKVFNLQAKDAESSLSRLNVLSAATASSATDISQSVSKASSAWRQMGGELTGLQSTAAAMLEKLRQTPEEVGTGIKSVLARLQRPSTRVGLKDLGVDLDGAGPMEAARRLQRAFSGLKPGDTRASQLFESLGGLEQYTRVAGFVESATDAQKLYAEALAGQKSLTIAATAAQTDYITSFSKTREELLELVRGISETKGFSEWAHGLNGIAQSAIGVADALKPVLPVLATFGVRRLIETGVERLGPSPRKRFASGGWVVPGAGEADSVPADLPVGSFVLHKGAVRALGGPEAVQSLLNPGEVVVPPQQASRSRGRLEAANRYARGGWVGTQGWLFRGIPMVGPTPGPDALAADDQAFEEGRLAAARAAGQDLPGLEALVTRGRSLADGRVLFHPGGESRSAATWGESWTLPGGARYSATTHNATRAASSRGDDYLFGRGRLSDPRNFDDIVAGGRVWRTFRPVPLPGREGIEELHGRATQAHPGDPGLASLHLFSDPGFASEVRAGNRAAAAGYLASLVRRETGSGVLSKGADGRALLQSFVKGGGDVLPLMVLGDYLDDHGLAVHASLARDMAGEGLRYRRYASGGPVGGLQKARRVAPALAALLGSPDPDALAPANLRAAAQYERRVKALLTPGEVVLGPADARRVGYRALDRLNRSDSVAPRRYANGGRVVDWGGLTPAHFAEPSRHGEALKLTAAMARHIVGGARDYGVPGSLVAKMAKEFGGGRRGPEPVVGHRVRAPRCRREILRHAHRADHRRDS